MIRGVDYLRLGFNSPLYLTHAPSMFAPFGTPGTNLSATWHPEPRERGTFNILSTCLTTMILCVWTSVHLNIPEHNGGIRRTFLRKSGWLLLALLAPEIVAWNAWEQRHIAAEITNISVKVFSWLDSASMDRTEIYPVFRGMDWCSKAETCCSLHHGRSLVWILNKDHRNRRKP
jgi:hypothetical protein